MDELLDFSLDATGTDLVEAARRGQLTRVRAREAEVARVVALLEEGRSVLIVGEPGAGKTAVIHGIAHAMAVRGKGGIRQLSTSDLMAGTVFLGQWQTKLAQIAEQAEEGATALYFTDVLNLTTGGTTVHDRTALIDALRNHVVAGRLALLAEATPDALNAIRRAPALHGLFERVRITPLPRDAVHALVEEEARRQDLALDAPCRRALVELTDRFGAGRHQPGPALELLRRVRRYRDEKGAVGEPDPVDRAFIEKVFSIYSGLPLFVVSREATLSASELRRRLQERIIGQRDALEALVETMTLFKAGLHDPARPIGTFLFVGPTGVGKTEVARALARLLFGSEKRMLRFDMSEFKDHDAFEMLLGNPDRPEQGARLLEPVREQPFQVLLFDELEKAHPNIWDLFLQLLDDGQLTSTGGSRVSFRNTIVIATSNAGVDLATRPLGFGAEGRPDGSGPDIRAGLEQVFRPEFLNRFQHIVVFRPLAQQELRQIARLELDQVMCREGIVGRGLVVDVDDAAIDLVVERGFDPRYGARALKREVQRQIVLPMAAVLAERAVAPGMVVRGTVADGRVKIRLVETAASREAAAEQEPVSLPDGRRLSGAGLAGQTDALHAALAQLACEVDEPGLRAELERLDARRRDHPVWKDPELAANLTRDWSRRSHVAGRLERLRERLSALRGAAREPGSRRSRADAAHRLVQLEEAIATARRELVTMGADGFWDALVEVRPLSEAGARARDLVVGLYVAWAEGRNGRIDWIRDPVGPAEPAVVAVRGRHPFGYLALEAGLHRVRDGDDRSIARVRVAPWLDARRPVVVRFQTARKGDGPGGRRIRSRVECEGGLVLQNARTLAENRELAAELVHSWSEAPQATDVVVRRYDVTPFRVRDELAGVSTGSRSALASAGFHRILCARVDAAAPAGPDR